MGSTKKPPSTGKAKPRIKPPPGNDAPIAEDFPAHPLGQKEQGQLHQDSLTRSPDGHFTKD